MGVLEVLKIRKLEGNAEVEFGEGLELNCFLVLNKRGRRAPARFTPYKTSLTERLWRVA
jgi:hypothetical protein